MKRTLLLSYLAINAVLVSAQDVKIDTIVPAQKIAVARHVSHWSFVIKGGVDDFSMAPPAPTYSDRFNPTGGVALEYTLNPLLGLGVEYDYSDYSRPYTYMNTIGDLYGSSNDALLFGSVNLSNAFAPLRSGSLRKLNVYGLVGGGVAIYHGEIDNNAREYKTTLVGKLGLALDYTLSKVMDLTLEGKYHQYDATSLCNQSVSRRCNSAMMLTAGLRFKIAGKEKPHVRNVAIYDYSPKVIPVVEKTTFVKGESAKTHKRIVSVEHENAALNLKIQKAEADAKLLAESRAAAAQAELQRKLDEKDLSAKLLEKKIKDLEEKSRQDSLLKVKEMAQLSAKDSLTANKLKQMEEDLKNLGSSSVKLTLENVQFKVGANTLASSSFLTLNQLVSILKSNTQWKSLTITGHTDNMGADAANLKLSQSRVNSVKTYLVSKGIRTSKLQAIGKGESAPVATNDTPEGRQKNRRVEFEIK